MENKKLHIHKTQEAILPLKDGLTYGALVKGIISDEEPTTKKSIFVKKDEDDGQAFLTFIGIDPKTKKPKQYKNHPWLTGKQKNVELGSYPEEVRKGVIESMKPIKGAFKDVDAVYLDDKEFKYFLQNDPALQKLVEDLLNTFETMVQEIQEIKKQYGSTGLTDFIKRYAFKKHIMVLGERGAGKTYAVSKYCEDNGFHTEFLAGHSGLESIDLLGYYIKNESGNLVWMDGPLTAAFRKAQTEKAVLFVDEILRIPARELNILIGALTPDSTGHFNLRTNRIIDVEGSIGVSETLRVPMENLWVVSTTNIGANYSVEDMDLALQDRFRMLDLKIEEETVRQIVESCNDGKFNDEIINKLMQLYTTVNGLVQASELTYTMNVRYLCEIIAIAQTPKDLRAYLFDLTPNICSRTTDGVINEVEEQTYKQAVKALF